MIKDKFVVVMLLFLLLLSGCVAVAQEQAANVADNTHTPVEMPPTWTWTPDAPTATPINAFTPTPNQVEISLTQTAGPPPTIDPEELSYEMYVGSYLMISEYSAIDVNIAIEDLFGGITGNYEGVTYDGVNEYECFYIVDSENDLNEEIHCFGTSVFVGKYKLYVTGMEEGEYRILASTTYEETFRHLTLIGDISAEETIEFEIYFPIQLDHFEDWLGEERDAIVGEEMSFVAENPFIESSGDISHFQVNWNFGDGTEATTNIDEPITHIYSEPGEYMVWAILVGSDRVQYFQDQIKVTVIQP